LTHWWVGQVIEPHIPCRPECFQGMAAAIAGNTSSDTAASLPPSFLLGKVTHWRVGFEESDPPMGQL